MLKRLATLAFLFAFAMPAQAADPAHLMLIKTKAKFEDVKDAHDPSRTVHRFVGFEQVSPGKLNARQYDEAVADLVAYLNWMAEPSASIRVRLGVWVLIFLALFTVIAWRLNAAYWKDVK